MDHRIISMHGCICSMLSACYRTTEKQNSWPEVTTCAASHASHRMLSNAVQRCSRFSRRLMPVQWQRNYIENSIETLFFFPMAFTAQFFGMPNAV